MALPEPKSPQSGRVLAVNRRDWRANDRFRPTTIICACLAARTNSDARHFASIASVQYFTGDGPLSAFPLLALHFQSRIMHCAFALSYFTPFTAAPDRRLRRRDSMDSTPTHGDAVGPSVAAPPVSPGTRSSPAKSATCRLIPYESGLLHRRLAKWFSQRYRPLTDN